MASHLWTRYLVVYPCWYLSAKSMYCWAPWNGPLLLSNQSSDAWPEEAAEPCCLDSVAVAVVRHSITDNQVSTSHAQSERVYGCHLMLLGRSEMLHSPPHALSPCGEENKKKNNRQLPYSDFPSLYTEHSVVFTFPNQKLTMPIAQNLLPWEVEMPAINTY